MYVPLHIHSFFSILDGFGSPEQNASRAAELKLPALGMTDHGNIFGHMQHISACKKHSIKPILGIELYVVHQCPSIKNKNARNNSHMVVWAKNYTGWQNLCRIVTQTNKEPNYYYKPRIGLYSTVDSSNNTYYGLDHFFDGNIMGFSGHQGSHLSDNLFCDLYSEDFETERFKLKKGYGQYKITDDAYYAKYLKPNWLESTCELALKMEALFGKGNFFIELQNECNPKDQIPLYVHRTIVNCLREVSKQTGIPAVASSDPHYARPEDAEDQRAMVMIKMKETEESVSIKLQSDEETDVMVFFGTNSFYIHSYEEMKQNFTHEELQKTVEIANQIEQYDISHAPYMPNFQVPNMPFVGKHFDGISNEQDKYLIHLCIEGAKEKQPWNGSNKTKNDYWNKLNEEKNVIIEAKLSNYFLVVWDYCMAADHRPADHSFDWQANLAKNGPTDPIPRGVGRGSAAGCLISYLIGITNVDPIKHKLLFTRFYNKGRNTGKHIELPDIDTDFAVEDREWVIDYLKYKYGSDKVSQIITFQRIQGRAAWKDLVRVKGIPNGFELSNIVSKFIPSEAEVADELQEMKEAGHNDYGLIQWAVDNSQSILEYYEKPELKSIFDQAMRCEGKKRGQGKHPSGVVVTKTKVEDCFPMVIDPKSKQLVIGVDMNDMAKMGGVKLDILGTAILDKLKMTQDLVNGKVPRRNRRSTIIEDDE